MKLKIIYLDDEVDLLEMFRELHQTTDIQIHTLTDPKLIEEKISEVQPDLVILDHRLPGTTGDELAMKLPEGLPKILITGELMIQPQASFMRIFHKPYQIDEMTSFLGSLAKTSTKQEEELKP